jgi:hypothetical protein
MDLSLRDYRDAAAGAVVVIAIAVIIVVSNLTTFIRIVWAVIIVEIAVFAVGDGDCAVGLSAWGLRHGRGKVDALREK